MALDSGGPAGSGLPVVRPVGEAAREGLGAWGRRAELAWGVREEGGSPGKTPPRRCSLIGGEPTGMARTSGRGAQRLCRRAPGSRRWARGPVRGELSMWRAKADDGLAVLRWFRDGALCAADGALSRRNPLRQRGKRRGTTLLVGCGSSKQSGSTRSDSAQAHGLKGIAWVGWPIGGILGRSDMGLGRTVKGVGPFTLFLLFTSFPINSGARVLKIQITFLLS
jgi:hypothetical protein